MKSDAEPAHRASEESLARQAGPTNKSAATDSRAKQRSEDPPAPSSAPSSQIEDDQPVADSSTTDQPASKTKAPEPEQREKPRDDSGSLDDAMLPPSAVVSTDVDEKSGNEDAARDATNRDDLLPPGVDTGAVDDPPEQTGSASSSQDADDDLLPPGVDDAPVDETSRTDDEDDLLPPAVDDAPADTTSRRTDDDDLLPPGVDDVDMPGEQVALPTGAALAAATGAGELTKGVLTEDGQVIALHDPVKTVDDGGEEIELHQLTPEEKAARRFRKNLIVWTVGLIVLVITMYCMR